MVSSYGNIQPQAVEANVLALVAYGVTVRAPHEYGPPIEVPACRYEQMSTVK